MLCYISATSANLFMLRRTYLCFAAPSIIISGLSWRRTPITTGRGLVGDPVWRLVAQSTSGGERVLREEHE